MLVREEKVTYSIVEGSLYKRTELVSKPEFPGRYADSWTSEYIRKATAQDLIGNV